ncbi:MAG: methionyl-tRNA formyltransferase [Chloroflexi bacterium]|nr:MAG: methionyl-tRNA formyltransferase [Chloroflexota bacterium]
MAKIVFMGTPQFAVPALEALIETQTVVGVVTQPDRPAGRGQQLRPSPVKVLAQQAKIPVYQPASLRREETAEPIRAWQPDIIVVAAFGQILRPHLLQLPPHGCLNVHASLLPRWRGASPIQHAILAGDTQTGISLMQMDEGLDTGPVYVQEAIPIHPHETAASLHDRLAKLGGEMLRRYLNDILNGHFTPTPQDNTQATYAPMIKKEDGLIRWEKTATELDRHIRAMTPWPGAFTHWHNQLLKILAAQPVPDFSPTGEPGLVITWQETIAVHTGQGLLMLETIQPAGKRPMSAADFARGRPDFINSKLGEL